MNLARQSPSRAPQAYRWALLLALLLVFCNAVQPGKVWEDDETVLDNPFMFGVRRIPYLFTPEYWVKHDIAQGGAFRPVVQSSFAIEYSLWRDDPRGYHITNVVLHALATLLSYCLVRRLTGRPGLAVVAAMLFAVHPTRAETVCWLKNRAENMCASLMLLSLICFHRAVAGTVRRRGPLCAAVACLALALLCKGMAAVLPLLAGLWVLCCAPKRRWPRDLLATAPLWAVVFAYVAFKLIVLSGDVPHKETPDIIPGWERCLIPGWTAYFYEQLIVWPTNLCVDRDFFRPSSLPWLDAAASTGARLLSTHDLEVRIWLNAAVSGLGLLIAVAPFGLVLTGRWRRGPAFFGCWFLAVLLPYVNILYIGVRPLADQRAYLPALTYCTILAGVLALPSRRRRLHAALVTLIAVALTCLTIQRNFAWRDMYALFHDGALGAPRMARVHSNLGASYHRFGRFRTAKRHLVRSVALDPRQPKALRLLGLTLARLKETDAAIEVLGAAFRLRQESVTARLLGAIYADKKRWDEAAQWFETAIQLRAHSPDALCSLGLCQWERGDTEAARVQLEKAVKQAPDRADAWLQLGEVYRSLDRPKDAARCYATGLRLAPGNAGAHHQMGLVLLQLGEPQSAEFAFERALAIDRGSWPAHLSLAQLYQRRGESRAAAGHMQMALRIEPRNADLWRAFGHVLEQLGQQDHAGRAFANACTLNPRDASAHLAAGDLAGRQGRLDEALRHYAAALKADPDCRSASDAVRALDREMATPNTRELGAAATPNEDGEMK